MTCLQLQAGSEDHHAFATTPSLSSLSHCSASKYITIFTKRRSNLASLFANTSLRARPQPCPSYTPKRHAGPRIIQLRTHNFSRTPSPPVTLLFLSPSKQSHRCITYHSVLLARLEMGRPLSSFMHSSAVAAEGVLRWGRNDLILAL